MLFLQRLSKYQRHDLILIMYLGMNNYIFAVFKIYLHCFMVAFVVRLSNLLFCDIWRSFLIQNDPFILKHYSLIVTVIVYHVPSTPVSVFIQLITILSQQITLKRITSCLLVYIRDCNLITCFIGFFFSAMLFE